MRARAFLVITATTTKDEYEILSKDFAWLGSNRDERLPNIRSAA